MVNFSQHDTEKLANKVESYIERRQLFKNIWDAAMRIDDKDDVMNKPKLIKTLRMEEIDKCPIGKKKKQRIRNLRHVCKRILDFCDKQDADDLFYEKVAQCQQVFGVSHSQVAPKRSAAGTPTTMSTGFIINISPDKISDDLKHSGLRSRKTKKIKKRSRKTCNMFNTNARPATPTIVATMVTSKRTEKVEETAGPGTSSVQAEESSGSKDETKKQKFEVKNARRSKTDTIDEDKPEYTAPKRKLKKKYKTVKRLRKKKPKAKQEGSLPQIISV